MHARRTRGSARHDTLKFSSNFRGDWHSRSLASAVCLGGPVHEHDIALKIQLRQWRHTPRAINSRTDDFLRWVTSGDRLSSPYTRGEPLRAHPANRPGSIARPRSATRINPKHATAGTRSAIAKGSAPSTLPTNANISGKRFRARARIAAGRHLPRGGGLSERERTSLGRLGLGEVVERPSCLALAPRNPVTVRGQNCPRLSHRLV